MNTLPLMESELSDIPEYKKIHTEYTAISDRFFLPASTRYYQSENGIQLSKEYEYDDLGRIITATDEAGNIVYTEYDDEYIWLPERVWFNDPENIGDTERVSEVSYLYSDNLLLGATNIFTKYGENKFAEERMEYDHKYGGILSYRDGNGNRTYYEYDNLGRILKITYPLFRTTSFDEDRYLEYANNIETYTYSVIRVNGNYYQTMTMGTYIICQLFN